MDFILDIGIDLNEIDDAFEIVHEKRKKEQDFIDGLALALNRMLDNPSEAEDESLTTGREE
ncbi:hypothetical protein P4H70_04525 [Paenibacillus ehimensis]|uniref:hypothetical protein n=1 Tax=Paenibacillus ehimensis TaxID=79264 RepID=UPI002DBC6467|nr:hypothetical protein [Paenibacillus ehimensis]MEC0208206.1 hypothetical protein [Paenibacillus ehimensis]